MSELLEQIVEQSEQVAEESEKETTVQLATISTVETDGLTLAIDGNDDATDKHYKANTGVLFKAGDRVKVTKESGSYIVDYPIGVPNSNLIIPSGGSDGQSLLKDGSTDYSVKWGTINITSLLPSGTTGQYLQKTATGVQWADVTATTDKLTSGTYTVTLSSTTLVPNSSNTISLGTSSYPYKDLYANGTIKLGNSYGSYLGFFGTTPITRQSLPDSSTLANVITKLRNYGLFSQY